jgi:hypothetical protein
MLLMARRSDAQILLYRPLAMSLALAGLGLVTLDMTPSFGSEATWLVANVLFAFALAIAMAVLSPAFYRRMDRRAAASAVLDGGIMLLAGTTVLITAWRTGTESPAGADGYLVGHGRRPLRQRRSGCRRPLSMRPLALRGMGRHPGSADSRLRLDCLDRPHAGRSGPRLAADHASSPPASWWSATPG